MFNIYVSYRLHPAFRLSGFPGGTLLFLICSCFLFSCKQDAQRVPIENDGVAPGTVSDVRVENLHGAAKITYTLPSDIDLLYIQADYERQKGVKSQQKASFVDNTMLLQGFGDTMTHEVTLYAVDRGGNMSNPVTVDIKPLLSPVQQAYDSLSYEEDFGGITVSFVNETMANLVITVMVKDSTGEWTDYDKDYTGQQNGQFLVRGLAAVPTTFGVYIQDRWGNRSDTMIKTLVPLFEEELDKTKFKVLPLDGDAKNTWTISALWDNNTTALNGFHTEASAGFPVSFTVDLGVTAKLSRLRTWQVHDGREYSSGNIKEFELWGSTVPDPTGSYDGWTLLATYTIKKPSGLPVGQLSNEDIETAAAGDESVVPIDAPEIRYIRIKALSSFDSPQNSRTGSAWLIELSFWGQVEP